MALEICQLTYLRLRKINAMFCYLVCYDLFKKMDDSRNIMPSEVSKNEKY